MKSVFQLRAIGSFALWAFCSAACFAQAENTDAPVVRIAKFGGDRDAAISFTFDDGLRDQMTLALPMLGKNGFKATFWVIPGRTPDTKEEAEAKKPGEWGGISWPELAAISAQGNEIGSHSWSHPNLTKLDDAKLQEEIDKADQRIAEKTGKAPLSFCYPYNAVDDRVRSAVMRNHIAAREFQFGIGSRSTIEQLNGWVDGLVAKREWGVTMIHGIADGFDKLSSPQLLDDFFRYVKQNEKQIWVDTFANVSRYALARDASKVVVIRSEPQKLIFAVECKPGAVEKGTPLTVVTEVKGALSAEAVQSGSGLRLRCGRTGFVWIVFPGRNRWF